MAKGENLKATEVLSGAVNDMIDNKLKKINHDRTRVGLVQSINIDKTYNVLIDGKLYNNIKRVNNGL